MISGLTGLRVFAYSVGWIAMMILLFVALEVASARAAMHATSSGEVAVIGFSFGPMTWFVLFGPPVALVLAWRRYRAKEGDE